MGQIQALQFTLEPSQFGKTRITDGPVGQQSGNRREDIQRLTGTRGVSREESGYEDIGRIGFPSHPFLELRNQLTETIEGT